MLLAQIAWMAAVVFVYGGLLDYENKSEPTKPKPSLWPTHSSLKRFPGRMTVTMFVHPKCPCSRASLSELSVLLTRRPELYGNVVFLKPSNTSKDWHMTDSWFRAKSLKGVNVFLDECGKEATIFGATSSGETLVYNSKGQLVFDGGITLARGHEGDNRGLFALQEISSSDCKEDRKLLTRAPVFGCSLLDCPFRPGNR